MSLLGGRWHDVGIEFEVVAAYGGEDLTVCGDPSATSVHIADIGNRWLPKKLQEGVPMLARPPFVLEVATCAAAGAR